jgi:putative transposase
MIATKRHIPEEIVSKLRQVDVLRGQGLTAADAIRQIGITSLTCYRWRKTYGGRGKVDQLRVAVSDTHRAGSN